MGMRSAAVERDRISTALRCASECDSVVVLKGARTIIAGPAGEWFVNPTGNPGMASGGTGDVLAGLIASLVAQGLPPFRAAVAGVYLHGRAGDLARDRQGEAGLIAGDVAECLPAAIKGLKQDHCDRQVAGGLYRIAEWQKQSW
jgi:NAD(P)H-hydrate epimerase